MLYILNVTLDFPNQDKIPDIRSFISPGESLTLWNTIRNILKEIW